MATLALTQQGEWRKRFTVQEGFPPEDAALKLRVTQWLSELSRQRGALELLVRPGTGSANSNSEPFLATCALGFRDPAVPSGVWPCPNPQELCAVAGGYAYVIDTAAPEESPAAP